MKNTGNHYVAKDGNFIVRKKDDFVMGIDIYLGDDDNIVNYTEKPYTEDEYKAFCDRYGVKTDKPKETAKRSPKR